MKKSMSKARILAYLLGGMCVTGSIAGTANAADTNNVYGAPYMYIHTNIAGEYTDELRTQIKNSGLKTNEDEFDNNGAVGGNSIAIGYTATSEGNNSIAIGSGADNKRDNSVAIGSVAVADGAYSMALGTQVNAAEEESIAMGHNAGSMGERSISIGTNSEAKQTNSIALGTKAKAGFEESIAIGREAATVTNKTIAIGSGAKAHLVGSIALGDDATTGGVDTDYFEANKRQIRGNIAIGSYAHAQYGMATALGVNAKANETYSTALGSESRAIDGARAAVAVGPYAYVGSEAKMKDQMTFENHGRLFYENISESSQGIINFVNKNLKDFTEGDNSCCISKDEKQLPFPGEEVNNLLENGKYEEAEEVENKFRAANEELKKKRQYASVAMGLRAQVTGCKSVAVGMDAGARNNFGGAFGTNARSLADAAYAVGSWSVAEGKASTAVGSLAHAVKDGSVAVGSYANAEGEQAMAMGNAAEVKGDNGVAIGFGASAAAKNSVALGAFSSLEGEAKAKDGAAYLSGEAISAETGVVSVGTAARKFQDKVAGSAVDVKESYRRIANVNGGVEDHDAVNVKQLKSIVAATGLTPEDISKINRGDEDAPKTIVERLGDIESSAITEIAGDRNISVAADAANPNKRNVTLNNRIGLSDDTIVINAKDQNAYITVGLPNRPDMHQVKIDGKEGTVTGLTNLKWDKDKIVSGRAATEDQLKAAVSKIKPSLKYSNGKQEGYFIDLDKDSLQVAGDGNIVTEAKAGGVINVKLGESVLKDIAANKSGVAKNAEGITNNKNDIDNLKKGWNLGVKAGAGKASGDNAQIQADSKVELQAGKNIVLTQNGASVDVAVADKIEVEEVKAGNSVLNKDGVKADKVSVGDVAIDKDGINAGNKKITNVTTGEISETSKDAVNGSQLWKVKTTADKAAADADAALDKAKTNAENIKANGEKIAANEKAIAGNKEAIKNNADNIKANGEKIAANEKAITDNKAAIANNAKDIKVNGDKIAANEKAIAGNKEAIKNNADNIKANGEKIKANGEKIAANEKAIAGNKEAIANNAKDIKVNGERITANEKAITDNKAAIANNAKDIKANGEKIAANEKAIAGNKEAIANNAKDIKANGERITANEKAIAGNKEAIKNNADNIKANGEKIAANSKDIDNLKKGWNLSVKAGEGKASGANTQIQADGKVELQAGKNIVLTQNGANVDVAVADKIEVEEVKAGNSVLNKDGVKADKVSVGDVAIDKDGINAGNKKITNLAPGAVSETSKDAVNGSQLWKVKTTADKAAADADVALDKAKTNAKDIKANGEKIAANSDKITANEKAIAGNKEAIKNNAGNIKSNGERIAANKDAIDKNAGAIADNAKDIKANGDKIEVNSKDIINLKKGWNLGVKAGAGKASGSNTQILADGKVELQAGKNIVLTQNGANVDVAVADKIEVEEVKVDKVSIGDVAIDKDGINTGNKKITNVTAGAISETSKDAVNGSQLWDVKTTADKAAADAGNALNKIDEVKKDLREQPVAFVDEEGNRIFKEGNKWLSEAGEDITAAVKPENLNHSLVSADGSVNTPSRLHNVAAGVMDTDAVNVGQLKAVDNRVSGVERAVSDVRDDMEHAGALGAALSALKPLAYDPMEKTQIMAGVGYYSSKTAFAIGLAHHDNEDTLVHGGLSMSNGSKVMVNAGVSWRIGRHKNRKDLPEIYYDGPISAVKDMTKEMEILRTENTDLKAAYEQVKNDNAALHAENQEMKQQIAMLMKHLGL